MKIKFRLIFLPFLWIDIGCIVIYTFLNWLLFIYWQTGPVKEEIRNLWIPFCLPWIPLVIWLRPRLRILKFNEKAKSPVFGTILLAGIAILAPLLIAQAYLETATGKLTHVNKMEEIGDRASTKYYTVDNFFIDTTFTGSWFTRTVTGKYNNSLDLDLYIVCPVYSDSGQVSPGGPGGVKIAAPHAWIVSKFYRQISNRSDADVKREKIRTFYNGAWVDFRQQPLSGFTYFERIGYSDDYSLYQLALGRLLRDNVSGTRTIFLKPRTEAFAERNGHKLAWIFGAFGIGTILFWLMLRFFPLKEPSPEA